MRMTRLWTSFGLCIQCVGECIPECTNAQGVGCLSLSWESGSLGVIRTVESGDLVIRAGWCGRYGSTHNDLVVCIQSGDMRLHTVGEKRNVHFKLSKQYVSCSYAVDFTVIAFALVLYLPTYVVARHLSML